MDHSMTVGEIQRVLSIVAGFVLVIIVIWLTNSPELEPSPSPKKDSYFDCYNFIKLNEYYKQTYGKELEDQHNFENNCITRNPFAEQKKVQGNGLVYEIDRDPGVEFQEDTGKYRIYSWHGTFLCKSLPCKQ